MKHKEFKWPITLGRKLDFRLLNTEHSLAQPVMTD